MVNTELRLRETLQTRMLPSGVAQAVQWRLADGLVDYGTAVATMNRMVAEIAAGGLPETIWLVEHPPLYTAGTSARGAAATGPFPVHESGRGGQMTYHGPGQRVVYCMLDLTRRSQDLRAFVAALEAWIIATLADFGVRGERREDRVGVWVARPQKPRGPAGEMAEDKIAAIGIRVRRWVTFHGISINVEPDLTHFAGIVPCGITAGHLGVTSLVDLGLPVTMADVDEALRRNFEPLFGPWRG